MKKDYIIWTPGYSVSNGVRVLHLLSIELQKMGYNVYLYSEEPHAEGFEYIDKISDDLKKNAVVVYPEVVEGNPLRVKNVARYVLYHPGVNGGNKQYHPSETVFTYSSKFFPDVPVLTIPTIDETLFYDDNSPKTQNCYFINKRGKFREAKETEGLLEINLNFPETRKELADLLRTTGTLYSYDKATSLADEALLCGAKVKVVTEEGVEDFYSNYIDDTKNFEQQMHNFIEITQKLDYKGKIKQVKIPNLKKYIAFHLKYFIFKYIDRDDTKMIKYKNRIRGF